MRSIAVPESEVYVLGAMINQPQHLATGCNELALTDFDEVRHQELFKVCQHFYQQQLKLNYEELVAHLMSHGGRRVDLMFALNISNSINFSHHLKRLKERALLRKAQAVLLQANNQVADAGDASEFLETVIKGLSSLEIPADELESHDLNAFFSGEQGGQGTLIEHLKAKQEEAKLRKPGELYIDGLPTKFVDLDRMFQGLKPGTLHIVAGRPSMGKTTFALNIARNLCCQEQIKVGIVSYEMKFHELWPKFIAAQAEIAEFDINAGTIKHDDLYRIRAAQAEFAKGSIYVKCPLNSSMNFARSLIRRLVQQDQCQIIMIDYLQKITASAENRYQEVSQISLSLGLLARQLNVPILCLAQLSRKTEGRADNLPMMSDLRDSGSIEQDADTVSLIFRKDYYDKAAPAGESQIIVAKNRKGPTGTVKLAFNPTKSLFSDFSNQEDEGEKWTV